MLSTWKMLINSYSCQNYSKLFSILLCNLVSTNKNTPLLLFITVKCLNKLLFSSQKCEVFSPQTCILLFHNRILISLIHDILLQRSRRNIICRFYTWELLLPSAVVDSKYIVYWKESWNFRMFSCKFWLSCQNTHFW